MQFHKAKIIDDGGVWLCLKVDSPQQARKFVAEMKDKPYIAELKEYRPKRSLNANAYAWKLINEMANVLRSSKDQVYLEMLKRYGQSEIISIRSDVNIAGFIRYYEECGTGEVKGKKFTHYKVFKGSSEFDTREMSILIDGIVSECKEMGIETLPPHEIALIKEDWGK